MSALTQITPKMTVDYGQIFDVFIKNTGKPSAHNRRAGAKKVIIH